MWKKINLLMHTLYFLKPIQLLGQLGNRLKSKRYIQVLKARVFISLKRPFFFCFLPSSNLKYKGGYSFTFLNITHSFSELIDWNYMKYGKLWNYNLEYFDYLQQEDITVVEKLKLINDFYNFCIINKRVLEPYPVSLRSINLIKFTLSNKLEDEDFHNFLYQELAFLNKNYEYHILGNHLLENAFALCMGGAFFSNEQWHLQAVKVLYRELDEQILADGAHFELSPMYHKIILFRLLELIDWYSNYDNKDQKFLSFCKGKAMLMLDWLENIKFENEDIPLFNDAAKDITYESSVLVGYAELLGVVRKNLPLGESGYRSFNTDLYELKMDFAQIGASYQAGHAHADALSFILYIANKALFVEQGTSTYQIGSRRDLERSTEAHNTVVVNGRNQSQVWGGFRVAKRAVTTIHIDQKGFYEASHNGYADMGVIHKRKFVCDSHCIKIIDELSNHANGVCYLHMHPDRILSILSEGEEYSVDDKLRIKFKGSTYVHIEEYEYADSYNKYQLAQRFVISFTTGLETNILFENQA